MKPTPVRQADDGLSCADVVVRAMIAPERWWIDLAEIGKVSHGAVREAGARLDASRRKRIGRDLVNGVVSWTHSERRKIAETIRESARYAVDPDLSPRFLDAGILRDAQRASDLIDLAQAPDRPVWIEFPSVRPGLEGCREGILVERTDPTRASRWRATGFRTRPDGKVWAWSFVSVLDAHGYVVRSLDEPYRVLEGPLDGLPATLGHSGLGIVERREGEDSFVVPEGREGSIVLSPSPLFVSAVGNLRNDMNARSGRRDLVDAAFVRSVRAEAGHLQMAIVVLAAIGAGRISVVPVPGGTLHVEALDLVGDAGELVPPDEDVDLAWTAREEVDETRAMPLVIGIQEDPEEISVPIRPASFLDRLLSWRPY